jgi:xylulokinase
MACVIGCDIGTSGTKAIVVREDGRVLGSALVEYPLSTPHPGWAEQDPELWVKATFESIQRALRSSRVKMAEVRALGFSGQMHSSVFLDERDNVLRPALLWCDTRTTEECAEITRKAGGEKALGRMVANPALEGFTLPKVLWLRKHEKERFKRVRTVLLPKDYVRFRLTGEKLTEVTDAAGTLAFDVLRRRWSGELLKKVGVPEAWFPEVRESFEPCGVLTVQAAKTLGLLPGIPVVGGGADNPCGAVGCGVLRPGDVLASVGTSGVMFAPLGAPQADPALRLHTFCHAVPGTLYAMGVMLSAGYALRWYRDTLGETERRAALSSKKDAYDLLAQEAARVAPGCEGLTFLPYLMGERTPHRDAKARAAFVGASARHDRAHFARAVFEGVTFGLADSLRILRERKAPIRRVVATGGGAKSPFWLQMMADVFGTPVETVAGGEGPAFGAAILAMTGCGLYRDVPTAAKSLVKGSGRKTPDAKRHKAYQEAGERFRALYPALKDWFQGNR